MDSLKISEPDPDVSISVPSVPSVNTVNEEQAILVNKILKSNKNYFISGAAGVGKTYILKVLIQEFSKKYNNPNSVGVTAMTGIAATSIGGMTLHAFAGLGHDGKRKPSSYVLDRWCRTKVLIIDEVSMLTAEFLDSIYKYILLYDVQIICLGCH
jgi:ATP-dependent DNA helicase PIF1